MSIAVGGYAIDGWTSYAITSSMLDPCDQFELSRPFDRDAHKLCRTDAEVTVRIDDTPILTGRIDVRDKDTSREESVLTISGRDLVGRLVQESAPDISYDGLDLVEVVKRLASPWFTKVSLSDARNRTVRLGKRGRKAAAAGEDLVIKVKKKTWKVEPGQMRWKIINELCSEAGYMVWAASDGTELIIGQPNYKQGVQFLVAHPDETGKVPSTATKIKFTDSVGDRYSMIMALGSGQGSDVDYGEGVASHRGVAYDGPGVDGVGRDFVVPKRLVLVERTLANIAEAKQHAERDKNRRDFQRHVCNAVMPGHGQVIGNSAPTLFAPNTIARVIDHEQDPPIDGNYLIVSCSFRGGREVETTDIQLVPSGTVFAQ